MHVNCLVECPASKKGSVSINWFLFFLNYPGCGILLELKWTTTKYQKASYQLLSAQVWTNGRDLYIPPGMMRLGYLIYLAITMPCYLGLACLCGHGTSGLCASHRLQTWRACQDTHGEALCMTFGEGGEGKWEQASGKGHGYWEERGKDQRQNWEFE